MLIGFIICNYCNGQLVRPENLNFGFSSGKLLYTAHTPIRPGAKIVAIDSHIFYIGTNNKICEYLWNGTTWTGGGQLEWSTNYVQANTQICNNGYELFFVRTSDNMICHLIWNGTWQANPISTSMIPVRSGEYTELIYNNNVIYYVGSNNKVCYLSRPNSNSAFNSTSVTIGSVDVASNTQIIYVGTDINNTTAHIYYIGTNYRIWDISNINSVWSNSGNYLAAGSNLPPVKLGTQLTNDKNQIFYVGTYFGFPTTFYYKLHEIHWDPILGWVGSLISPAGVQFVNNYSQITYFDNHIYYVGANDSKLCHIVRGTPWTGGTIGDTQLLSNSSLTAYNGTTGPTIFSIDQSHRIRITLWDDVVYPSGADCSQYLNQKTWYNGKLNTTANLIYGSSNIAITFDPNNPNATPKSFYYMDADGYVNVFLRSFLNDPVKVGWTLTFSDEFNSKSITKAKWYSQLPWSNGYCLNTTQQDGLWNQRDQLWGQRQYGTDWSNFTIPDHGNFEINNGIGSIKTKTENPQFSGMTWGDGVGQGHFGDYYGAPWNYNYTNSILSTGGVNVNTNCPDYADQYCICGGVPPNCVYDRAVSTCNSYVPKYSGHSYDPSFMAPRFLQKYGYFEIRCKVPHGKYMWSAFWAVDKGFYPGEIDFFEIEGNGKSMLSNIYYENCLPGDHHTGSVIYETYALGYRYYDDFYTYACEWGPTYIKWYLNDELIATNSQPTQMQKDEMWIIVNNYVYYARALCEAENFPNSFDIDYVRVYQNPAWAGLINALNDILEEKIESAADFSVYPNPTNGKITVESYIGTNKKEINIDIFNVINQKEISLTYNDNETALFKKEIDLSNQKNGIYFIRFSFDGKSLTKKFILNKN